MIPLPLPAEIGARLLLLAHLRLGGGPGSGNFGHAGRPGAIGGSGSLPPGISNTSENRAIKWQKNGDHYTNAEPLKLYHGTTESAAKKIETEGLRYGNLSLTPDYAAEIADVRREGEAPVVFEVEAPAGSVYPVFHGPKAVRTDSLALAQTIKSVRRYQAKGLGGPGSGNFGHAGRPGAIGGSATDPFTRTTEEKIAIVRRRADSIAHEMGVDPRIIHVVDHDPTPFVVGNKQFHMAAFYDPRDKHIEINSRNSFYDRMSLTNGIVAHEISHAIYDRVVAEQAREHQTIRDMQEDEFNRLFKRNGYPRPESAAELTERFPASAMFAKTWGDPYLSDSNNMGDMIAENGHSAYAKSYWAEEARDTPGGLERAVNETIAEVTRYQVAPMSWEEEGQPAPKSPWVRLAEGLREVHQKIKDRTKV